MIDDAKRATRLIDQHLHESRLSAVLDDTREREQRIGRNAVVTLRRIRRARAACASKRRDRSTRGRRVPNHTVSRAIDHENVGRALVDRQRCRVDDLCRSGHLHFGQLSIREEVQSSSLIDGIEIVADIDRHRSPQGRDVRIGLEAFDDRDSRRLWQRKVVDHTAGTLRQVDAEQARVHASEDRCLLARLKHTELSSRQAHQHSERAAAWRVVLVTVDTDQLRAIDHQRCRVRHRVRQHRDGDWILER